MDLTYKVLPPVADLGIGGWSFKDASNCSLLIHSDTTDGSTTFVDTVGTHSPAVGTADVEHDTAQSRFGKSSILFDGNSGILEVPSHADFFWDAGIFTVDLWIRIATLPAVNDVDGIFRKHDSITDFMQFSLVNTAGVYSLLFQVNSGGDQISVDSTWTTPVVNTWYHTALVRGWSGNVNDFAICVDGKLIGSVVTDASVVHEITADLEFGISSKAVPDYFDGWKDEISVAKGYARWTSDFIPPYGAYH